MLDNKKKLQNYIDTIIEIFKKNDTPINKEIINILSVAHISAEQTHHDNWDGGRYFFSIYIKIPVEIYNNLNFILDEIQETIKNELVFLLREFQNTHIQDIFLNPEANMVNQITELTRLEIFKIISIYPIENIDFLHKLFDLKSLPSNDWRYNNFYDDILQHTINNYDWENDWWWKDNRLNLLECSDKDFQEFLCEVIRWFIKPLNVENETLKLINDELQHDGFVIYNAFSAGKRTNFLIKKLQALPLTESIQFNESHIHDEWKKAIQRQNTDPEAAITTSRTLLESTFRYILDNSNIPYDENNDEVMNLYKKVAKVLKMSPNSHKEDVFKQILGGVNSVILGLVSLRNTYGDAHGKSAKSYRPKKRHSELAVNLSGSICLFLYNTFNENKNNISTTK